jgi:hypothetical protein
VWSVWFQCPKNKELRCTICDGDDGDFIGCFPLPFDCSFCATTKPEDHLSTERLRTSVSVKRTSPFVLTVVSNRCGSLNRLKVLPAVAGDSRFVAPYSIPLDPDSLDMPLGAERQLLYQVLDTSPSFARDRFAC